jgi:hydrogenase/urease accessory protein HupE
MSRCARSSKRPAGARRLAWLCALLLASFARPAPAHEMSMAEMELRELSKGQFIFTWGASGTNRPIAEDLTPRWPEGCRLDEQSLDCSPNGLTGELSIDGVGKAYSAALVRIIWLGGQTRVYTLTAAQPSVHLYGAADDARSALDVMHQYGLLGVEHILSGIDHLAFVLGLLFLVGFRRGLIGTITAFTLAHSVTLAASVLGWITLRSAPVETCIALSIVLVASEALRERQTLARRWPALVAFLFGLVHGLGFAGALREVGLPSGNLALPLLMFNVGVEVGQLLTVLAAFGATRALARFRWPTLARTPALYAIGVIAAYWSWLRLAAIGL